MKTIFSVDSNVFVGGAEKIGGGGDSNYVFNEGGSRDMDQESE